MDLEIIKLLTETGNPFINILALIGLASVIYKIDSIFKLKDKVDKHEKDINELNDKFKRFEDKYNEYSRKGGKR